MLMPASFQPHRPAGPRFAVVVLAGALALLLGAGRADAQVTNAPTPLETNTVPRVVPAPAAAAPTNAISGLDLASFKLITERNIFDPNRSGRSPRVATSTTRAVKSEAFSLVGTMSSDKGIVAFFDGSASEFKKVLKVAGMIAGYTVKDVTPSLVKLVADGKELELRVGMQLRRPEGGDWQVSEPTGAYAESGRSPSASAAGGASASSGGEDEVLKRLMQKREQESNNEK